MVANLNRQKIKSLYKSDLQKVIKVINGNTVSLEFYIIINK